MSDNKNSEKFAINSPNSPRMCIQCCFFRRLFAKENKRTQSALLSSANCGEKKIYLYLSQRSLGECEITRLDIEIGSLNSLSETLAITLPAHRAF